LVFCSPALALHRWATAQWDTYKASDGVSAMIDDRCLAVSDVVTQFVDDEVWLVMRSGYWVEAGVTMGSTYVGGYENNPVYFWAQDSGAGYREYFSRRGPRRGVPFRVSIRRVGVGRWRVRDGSLAATATKNYGPPASLQAGLEFSGESDDVLDYLDLGLTYDLGYYDQSGYHAGWGATAYVDSDPGASIAWDVAGRSFTEQVSGAVGC
jgi:hypothetical protein